MPQNMPTKTSSATTSSASRSRRINWPLS
jgi:hypothetical protein